MKELHKIQKIILKNLLTNRELRFAALNSAGISNDRFAFHLKRLIKAGIITKGRDGLYRLTSEGKEYANRFDIEGKEIFPQKQAKIGILVVGRDKDKRFLIQQRLKEPYYGYYGFVSGKIKWGESIYEAAKRELKEETGLIASNLVLKGIEHKIDYSQEGSLLEDKFFYIIEANHNTGQLKEVFSYGKNQWLSKRQIIKLDDLFDDVPKVIQVVENNKLTFFEDNYYVTRY